MDSKSVHRVAASLNVASRFDSTQKVWEVGEHRFTAEEIAKLSSKELRETLTPTGAPVVTTGRQYVKEANDGNSSVKDAMDVVKRNKPKQDETESAPRKPRAPKPAASDDGLERVALFKLKWGGKSKPKRDGESVAGKLWLRSFGMSKWTLRAKMKAHATSTEIQQLAKRSTQWYTPAEIKQLAKGVFDDVDKQVLANRERYTKKAVHYSEDARDLAEAMIAAAAAANGK